MFNLIPRRRESGRGCLFALALLGIIGLVLGGIGYYFYSSIKSTYTSPMPASLPVAQSSPEQYAEICQRFADIKQAADGVFTEQNPQGIFEIGAADLNAVIAHEPQWRQLRGRIFFKVENNQLWMDASIPLTQIPGFRDRYLNGSIGLTLSLENGDLRVIPAAILVGGQPVPEEFRRAIGDGVAEGFQNALRENPQLRQNMAKVKSLRLENNKLRLHLPPSSSVGG